MPSDIYVNVTVCQLRSEPQDLQDDWQRLVHHVRETNSDLVLLPEMPFYPWPFWRDTFVPQVWQELLDAHDVWRERLAELAAAVVLGSAPVEEQGKRLNRAFYGSTVDDSFKLGHGKYYLPDEAGFWEASWYARGDGNFEADELKLADGRSLCAGFLICTELWFMHAARAHGQAGAHILLTPRATEKRTADKWLAGGRAAAVIGGAYSLSSNHYRPGDDPVSLGGLGWVVGPDGEVLALTTPDNPFATVTIDLARAERAKHTYPRYVAE